jgi:uncharacterized membrane protein YeaQ/YmgE (transglycosylase-associated protein family)
VTFNQVLQVLGYILVGAIAGWLSSIILGRNRQQGCLMNVAVGIIGGFVGGFVMNILFAGGLIPAIGFLNAIINATVGAVIFLVILEILLPGKQLFTDRRRRRR